MYNLHCSVNNTCNVQDRQKEKSTVSDKNSWDTSTEFYFFPSFLSSLPPNVVYCSYLTKSCPSTLEGPEDSKVSKQFWLENNRKISIKYNSQNMTWVPLNFVYYCFSTFQNSLSFAVVLQGSHL